MTIDERFKSVYPRIQKIARKYANTTPIPYEEFESELCYEFLAIDKSFDPSVNNSYGAYVGAMLNGKAQRMSGAGRKERRFYDSIQSIEDTQKNEDGEDVEYELQAEVDIEEQIFDVMFVEEQLANADELTRTILTEFFTNPYASFREIARNLGLHDKLVKRRLEAVANKVKEAGAVSNV